MSVYVINQRKQPLMPTTPQKARKLLKQGKAKIVKRELFTIKLLYATFETKQESNLGVDAEGKIELNMKRVKAFKDLAFM